MNSSCALSRLCLPRLYQLGGCVGTHFYSFVFSKSVSAISKRSISSSSSSSVLTAIGSGTTIASSLTVLDLGNTLGRVLQSEDRSDLTMRALTDA